jgi:hypothetical protein
LSGAALSEKGGQVLRDALIISCVSASIVSERSIHENFRFAFKFPRTKRCKDSSFYLAILPYLNFKSLLRINNNLAIADILYENVSSDGMIVGRKFLSKIVDR